MTLQLDVAQLVILQLTAQDTDFSGEQSSRRYDALGGDLFASVMAAVRFQVRFDSFVHLSLSLYP